MHAKVTALNGQMRSAGDNAMQGLAAGITAGEGAAVSAATAAADAVSAAVRDHLQVHSPSRLWHQYGFWAVQGLEQGLVAGEPKLQAAVRNMINSINRAFHAGAITAAQKSSLVTWVESDNTRLKALAAQRKQIAAQIAAADKTDQALQSSFTSIIGLGHAPAAYTGKVPTAQQMVANLQTELADIKRFAADLKKLKALGLDNAIIQRIIAMGPMQGDAYAKALIAAAEQQHSIGTGKGKQGGGGTGPMTTGPGGGGVPSIIQQLDSAYEQIQSYSKSEAASVTNAMYEAGEKAAKGLVAGLKAQEKAIDKEMKKIAKTLVDAIKRDLKIHSPSLVMMEHGLAIAEGLAKGIANGTPMVVTAMRAMAAVVHAAGLAPYGGVPSVAGGHVPVVGPVVNPGGPMGHTTVVQVHLEVHGSVRDHQELMDKVRDGFQQYLLTNSNNGIVRRGR
jgi:hypothetical protein